MIVDTIPNAETPKGARFRPTRHPAFVAIAALCIIAATACIPIVAKGPPSLEAFVSARFISAPTGVAFVSAAWLPDTRGPVIWIRHESPSGASGPVDDPLYILDLETGRLSPLPLPEDPACKDTGHQYPETLPDGRLGYIQFCFGNAAPEREKKLMAYDFHSQTVAPLEPYFLSTGANVYAFPPDMKVGVINDGNGLYERLDWLLQDRQADVGLPWARAGKPSWSPNGAFIAVDAAPNALGRTGQDRGTLARKFYLLSHDGKVARVLLENVGEVLGAPLWSPDGRWLIASIDFPDGETGLWLINVQTSKVFHLFSGQDIGAPVWSPDHQSIAAPIGLAYPGVASPKVGLYILHVGNLDQLAARAAQ